MKVNFYYKLQMKICFNFAVLGIAKWKSREAERLLLKPEVLEKIVQKNISKLDDSPVEVANLSVSETNQKLVEAPLDTSSQSSIKFGDEIAKVKPSETRAASEIPVQVSSTPAQNVEEKMAVVQKPLQDSRIPEAVVNDLSEVKTESPKSDQEQKAVGPEPVEEIPIDTLKKPGEVEGVALDANEELKKESDDDKSPLDVNLDDKKEKIVQVEEESEEVELQPKGEVVLKPQEIPDAIEAENKDLAEAKPDDAEI